MKKIWCLGAIVCLVLAWGRTVEAQNAGFVYAACPGCFVGQNGGVLAYTIDGTTGALTPVVGAPFPAGDNPRAIAVDPTGRFVYVVNEGSGISGSISAYAINGTTGALTPVPDSPVSLMGPPVSIAIDPNGRFVFVAGGGGDVSGRISVYEIDQETGSLAEISGSPFTLTGGPVSVAVDRTGKFVYAAVRAGGNPDVVVGYRIRKSGVLEPLSGSPFPTENSPFSVATDAKSDFLYVACGAGATGNSSPTISAYTINRKNGELTQVEGSPYGTGQTPVEVTVDPQGRFVYVATALAQGIPVYVIDGTTGVLTEHTSAFESMATRSVAVDPTSRFVYAADTFGSSISTYSIVQATGSLTFVTKLPLGLTQVFSIATTAGPSACPAGDSDDDAGKPGLRLGHTRHCRPPKRDDNDSDD